MMTSKLKRRPRQGGAPNAADHLGGLIGAKSNPNNARFQYLVGRLHALGPRPVDELLREIVAGADVFACLETYARLDPEFVRMYGGDVLPIDRDLVVFDGGR